MTEPQPLTWIEVRVIRDKFVTEFATVDQINGVGISEQDDEYVLRVGLTEVYEGLPEFYDGVPVFTHVVGRVEAQVE